MTLPYAAARKLVDDARARGQELGKLRAAGLDLDFPECAGAESGSAFKEQGGAGLRFYTRIKTSAVRFAW